MYFDILFIIIDDVILKMVGSHAMDRDIFVLIFPWFLVFGMFLFLRTNQALSRFFNYFLNNFRH